MSTFSAEDTSLKHAEHVESEGHVSEDNSHLYDYIDDKNGDFHTEGNGAYTTARIFPKDGEPVMEENVAYGTN